MLSVATTLLERKNRFSDRDRSKKETVSLYGINGFRDYKQRRRENEEL